MTIVIECECGNKCKVMAPSKKYLQLRDNLRVAGFIYSTSDFKMSDGKIEEIIIRCKCGNYINLGMD